jgi:lipopolysaccharide transport system permease protein
MLGTLDRAVPPAATRRWPGLFEPITSLTRHPYLVWQLTRQEILNRYRGSVLGVIWSFITPLLLLAVFTLVFSVIFQAKWNQAIDSKGEFAVVLFAGFLVFWLFADCTSRAPQLIVQNVNFVKKIVFPLEILPWTVMLSALFHTAISAVVLLVFRVILFGLPSPTVLLFPLVLLPFVLMTMGVSWFLASIAVFYRDTIHAVEVSLIVLMYSSPIIYPLSMVPDEFRRIVELNPLTLVVQQSRMTLLWDEIPNWLALGAYFVVSWAVAWLGFAWFQKTKKGFANVV